MNQPSIDLDAIEREATLVERAIQQAVAEEIRRHKLLGQPIVIGVENQIRIVPAAEIELPNVPQD
ncbi:MAG: hypothetical protein KF708_20515 [Pirellulales bacterium]|nr:hypothetical protein [Pirellulales bacterium]